MTNLSFDGDYGGPEVAILIIGGNYGGPEVAILTFGCDYGGRTFGFRCGLFVLCMLCVVMHAECVCVGVFIVRGLRPDLCSLPGCGRWQAACCLLFMCIF